VHTNAATYDDRKLKNYVRMYGNYYYHKECIHFHSDTFLVEDLGDGSERVTEKNNEMYVNKPCPYPPIHHDELVEQSKKKVDHNLDKVKSLGYYSDWVAYAETTSSNNNLFTFFNSTWKVPEVPKSKGPLGLSSVYIFNGLEDGAGHKGNASLILQPVLSYGKSGCILSPTNWAKWNLVSYLVSGSGRAHCGKRIEVQVGDEVVGTMVNTGSNNWEVNSIHVESNEKSTYIGKLASDKTIDAAYITLEGMIIYSCDTFPNGSTTFFNNQLKYDSSGSNNNNNGGDGIIVQNPKWTSIVRHNECNQNVIIDERSGNVTLVYK